MIFRKRGTNNFCVPVAYVNGYFITESAAKIELNYFIDNYDAILNKKELVAATMLLQLPVVMKPELAQIMSRKDAGLKEFLKAEFSKDLRMFRENIDKLLDNSHYDSIYAQYQAKEIEDIIKQKKVPEYLLKYIEEIKALSYPISEDTLDVDRLNAAIDQLKDLQDE